MTAKKDQEINPGDNPLNELRGIAGFDSDLLAKIVAWENKWIVQYAVEDDVKGVLRKIEDPDEATDVLVKREEGVMQWLGAQLAKDCTLSETQDKLNVGKHKYSVLGIRKQRLR